MATSGYSMDSVCLLVLGFSMGGAVKASASSNGTGLRKNSFASSTFFDMLKLYYLFIISGCI